MANRDDIRANVQPQAGARAEDVATIPLYEEHVRLSKRQVETGRVRVHVQVDERQEILTEQLSRDDVEVERVARNEVLSEMPNIRLEGGTTIVPVVEEVVVVEKRLMLVEEIHIRRRTEIEQRDIPVTLRREQARVERSDIPGDASAASAASAAPPREHRP